MCTAFCAKATLQDGQLLGADIGVGSPAGAQIAWDSYSPSGMSTWYLQRITQDNAAPLLSNGTPIFYSSHLFATAGYERHRFGRIADLTYGAALTEGRRGATLQRETNASASLGLVLHLPDH